MRIHIEIDDKDQMTQTSQMEFGNTSQQSSVDAGSSGDRAKSNGAAQGLKNQNGAEQQIIDAGEVPKDLLDLIAKDSDK